jgi:hypothetical protein
MRKRLPTHLFFLLLLLVANSVLSQQREYIIGKLIDAKTQEPIVFASIRIKDRALGVISNVDGSFKIPLKYKEYGDIIEISSMGYRTKEILIQDFLAYELNNVRLQPATIELEEAVVTAKKKRKLTARQIVRRAIRSIPENYPVEPFSTVGYYRDYQLDGLQYVNLNEAILEVFDEGFDAMDSVTTKVKIFDYLENTDFKRDTLALQLYNYQLKEGRKVKVIDKAFLSSYGGNEFTILRVHDALRNYEVRSYSFVHRLKSDLLFEHKFKKEFDTYLDDEPLYTIRFEKLLLNYSAYGTMYISKRNFAIHKMEYTLYDLTKKLPNGIMNKHKTDNQLIFEITTEYHPENDKMYLNYISFHNTFRLWDPPPFFLETTTIKIEENLFKTYYNQTPDLQAALNKDNYILKYKEKKIDLKKIELDVNDENRKTMILYPKMHPNKAEEMFRSLDVGQDKVDSLLFSVKVSDIRDEKGNLINEWIPRDYNQFREFFVQEVKPNVKSPVGNLFMEKRKPIFKDQPIIIPDNFDDYWMNTPLQNIKN